MASLLDSMTDLLDAQTVQLLGDTIVYTPAGGMPVEILGHAARGSAMISAGGTGIVTGDKRIEVRKIDVPIRPAAGVIVEFAGDPARYEPRQVEEDDSGRWWLVALKTKTR